MAPLDRRSLLVGTAALGAALSSPALAAARPGRKRKLKKALKVGMIREGSTLRERFQIARDAGFDGVELDSPGDLDLDEALAASQATGLAIPGVVDSVHWQKTLGDPDPAVRAEGLAGLETALRDCRKVGGTSVLLVPAVVSPGIPYDAAWERSIAEIRKALPLAAELEVQIVFENVWNGFLLSPLEAARYVDLFESPWVGWHFDIGNIVNFGWPEQWIRILGPRIKKLDVKEYSRKKRDDEGLWKGFAVEIGEGDNNWPAVMAALDEIGYEGWAAAEVGGGDARRLADIAARMDRVFAL
jgi:L-ribulose-5-phosphate 3-epimerase